MDISNQIADLRKKKGITQRAMADLLGMDQGNYSKLEKRGEKMTIEQLRSIADALKVPLGELLGLSGHHTDTGGEIQIKNLEKEVGYLKKIVEAQDREREKVEKFVQIQIDDKLLDAAVELRLGTLIFLAKATGERLEVRGGWREVKKLPNYHEIDEGTKSGAYEVDLIYSEEEIHQMRQKAIEDNYEYWYLLDCLGFLDEEFSSQLSAYADKEFGYL